MEKLHWILMALFCQNIEESTARSTQISQLLVVALYNCLLTEDLTKFLILLDQVVKFHF